MAITASDHTATARKLIAEYESTWGFNWPYDVAYAAELYGEAASAKMLSTATPKPTWADARITALDAMRADHHFPDWPAPYGSMAAA